LSLPKADRKESDGAGWKN